MPNGSSAEAIFEAIDDLIGTGNIPVVITETDTIVFTQIAGFSGHHFSADTKISATAGNIITANADGLYVPTGGGAGSVTSVGLSLPLSIFTVSGSPVTTTGTLTGTFKTQTANTVFAGPTFGAAATPAFRALVAADIPASHRFGVITEDNSAGQHRNFTGNSLFDITLSDTQLIVRGVNGVGQAIPNYSDNQMYFNPRKAAFRCGVGLTGQFWDVNVGVYSAAFGANNTAVGDYSMSWGTANFSLGVLSTTWGNDCQASGSRSTAWGQAAIATGYTSTAWGEDSVASGHYSTASGFGTNAKSYCGTTIGTFNDSTASPAPNAINPLNRVFEIGIGTSNIARANALTVLGNGSIGIGILVPDDSALVQMESTTKGFILPRMTTAERDAIVSPIEGLLIYNLTSSKLNVYTSTWEEVTSTP
jgi:hypothetical protein